MRRWGKSIASSWNRVCKGKRQAPAGCIQGCSRHPDTQLRMNTCARKGGGEKHKGIWSPFDPKELPHQAHSGYFQTSRTREKKKQLCLVTQALCFIHLNQNLSEIPTPFTELYCVSDPLLRPLNKLTCLIQPMTR